MLLEQEILSKYLTMLKYALEQGLNLPNRLIDGETYKKIEDKNEK